MITSLLFAVTQGACTSAKCPSHALYSLLGALAIGWFIGFMMGRGGRKLKSGPARRPGREVNRSLVPPQPRLPVPEGACELFLGNVSFKVTEKDVRELLSPYGRILGIRIAVNPINQHPKGFAFAVMASREEALKAIAALNGSDFFSRTLRLNEARRLDEKRLRGKKTAEKKSPQVKPPETSSQESAPVVEPTAAAESAPVVQPAPIVEPVVTESPVSDEKMEDVPSVAAPTEESPAEEVKTGEENGTGN